MSRTISAGVAEDLMCRDDGAVVDGWKKLADQEIRESRWGTYNWLVLGYVGNDPLIEPYGLQYFRGATEMQENEWPWQGKPEDEQLQLTRLYPQTRIVTEYSDRP